MKYCTILQNFQASILLKPQLKLVHYNNFLWPFNPYTNVFCVLLHWLLSMEFAYSLHVFHGLLCIYIVNDHVHYIPIGLGRICHVSIETKLWNNMKFHVFDHWVSHITTGLNVFKLHTANYDSHDTDSRISLSIFQPFLYGHTLTTCPSKKPPGCMWLTKSTPKPSLLLLILKR